MLTLNEFCQTLFGEKLYKLCLSTGCTCPNRDGSLDTRGCIFCSAGGSGEFSGHAGTPIKEQITCEKQRISSKFHGNRFIAYFQSYSNTYGPVSILEPMFMETILREDIAVLSIATRPDCLGSEILNMLSRLNEIKPVWVELGLQTIHPSSASYIRRGYDLSVFDNAVAALKKLNIHTVVHLILGLPGETTEDMLASVKYVAASGAKGIKLQLLQILDGTDLADDWRNGLVPVMSMEEYISLITACVRLLPSDMVVHRLTGDGPKRLLLAPLWCGDKKRVMNTLRSALNNIETVNKL